MFMQFFKYLPKLFINIADAKPLNRLAAKVLEWQLRISLSQPRLDDVETIPNHPEQNHFH